MERTIAKKIEKLVSEVHTIIEKQEGVKLPSNSYFLNKDEVVCFQREFGNARYPYSHDGLVLWANSSGVLYVEEGLQNLFLNSPEGKEPNIAFFIGEKMQEGFCPISVTGVAKQLFEGKVLRYTVFSPEAVYYVTETENLLSALRAFVDGEKNIRFTLWVKNISKQSLQTYTSAHFNCFMLHANTETIETKWYRGCSYEKDLFSLDITEYWTREASAHHIAHIKRSKTCRLVQNTTSLSDYKGGMNNQLHSALPLTTGKFGREKAYTEFNDTAIAGDMIPLDLAAGEAFAISYTFSKEKVVADEAATTEYCDKLVYETESDFGKRLPKVEFVGSEIPTIEEKSFNYFLNNVFRQVEFCAKAKNYAGPFIGIRDIFQQLEAALMWEPAYCRKKIIEALNYIGEDGRAPRQYSYSSNPDALPNMDLRPYIDQGVWIISTVCVYLKFTGDSSILDEECGYYKFTDYKVDFSDRRDSVLTHLLTILDYLLSNLDEENHCLHALYGDWNDALDGLGVTKKEGLQYGNGVSVMATLQLYKNLNEMIAILGQYSEQNTEHYEAIKAKIQKGLLQYAVEKGSKERKILHGWGEDYSFKVGSFCDGDGVSRDSVTSNAFWAISDMISVDASLKKDILAAYRRLDSKYGIKTFAPAFQKEDKMFGRIVVLPEGTAENGAVYIHATLFAIWSLFVLQEDRYAWEQIEKILPITHKEISTTPFVMPNSYICNEEKAFDGESMSDWFTGSGCVLVKVVMWQVFGIQPSFDRLRIQPAPYYPFQKCSVEFAFRNTQISLCLEKTGQNKRRYYIDGVECDGIDISVQALPEGTVSIRITN